MLPGGVYEVAVRWGASEATQHHATPPSSLGASIVTSTAFLARSGDK